MKLLSYKLKSDSSSSFGVMKDDKICDIPANWPGSNTPRCIKELLRGGKELLGKIEQIKGQSSNLISVDEVKLLPPVVNPGKILALAGNYAEHIEECGLSLGLSEGRHGDSVPRPFIMPNTVLAGDKDTIEWPIFSETIDWEVELAVVIGKTCKCISAEQAKDYIAGYTVANDISARSVTFKAGRKSRNWDEFYDWLNGKWADGFLPMGPWLVTADEIGDAGNLDISLKINDSVRQNSNTSKMMYPPNEIVSFISHIMTLQPGDIICTGTPAGVGHATGQYLKAGDIIECYIEKIGELTNFMGKKPEKFYTPLES